MMAEKIGEAELSKRGTSRASAKRKKDQANPEHFAWFIFLVLMVATVLLVLVFGWIGGAWQGAILELIFAAGALSVGGLFGFLFGIPKSSGSGALTSGEHPADIEADIAKPLASLQASHIRYQPSTNLEQVSDWLTKILIGVGLVQMRSISEALANTGAMVERAFGSTSPGLGLLTQLVIITFLVIGFLATFLWTRIHYGGMQVLRDQKIQRELDALRSKLDTETDELRKDAADTKETLGLVASGELIQPTHASVAHSVPNVSAASAITNQPWPPELQAKIDNLEREPVDWSSDPIVEIFGAGPSNLNGRRLEGTIIQDLGKALAISLRIKSTSEAAPLLGEVAFILHPTYPERLRIVAAKDNHAELKIFAKEWFTVAAIADNGKTVLIYSLKLLPGAPSWFTSP